MLQQVAAEHGAAHKAEIEQLCKVFSVLGRYQRVAVVGQRSAERAAAGVQNGLEVVRHNNGAHGILLQVHHDYRLVFGGKHLQKVLGIPLFLQGALHLFVQAFQLAGAAVVVVVGLPVLPHGSLGLGHSFVQMAQVGGLLDAYGNSIVLFLQEGAHPVCGAPHTVRRLVGGQDDKFIAANAVHPAGSKELAGGIRQTAQQGVAAAVPQMLVYLVHSHHINVGAHHGFVPAVGQLPQVGFVPAAVGKAGQGVVAVREVQLLAELVGLCVVAHQHGRPRVLSTAAPAGQHLCGDPDILAGHVLAVAVELRRGGVVQHRAQGLQIGLLQKQVCVLLVHDLLVHQAVAVVDKIFFFFQIRTQQAGIPLDHPVRTGGKVQQRDLQHVIGKDLVRLQGQRSLFGARVLHPAVTAHQVAAQIPVILIGGICQQFFGVFHRHGLEEIVALRVQAVCGLQHGHLFRGLHTLGDDGQVQPVCHIHHRLHDLHALAAVLLIHVDELHVQLDGIDVGILEHIQRGIPAAEVVHHDREALAVQPLNGAFHHLGVLGHHGLGDLSQQKLWLQLIFFHQICKDLRHIQVQDILHRNVYRHRHKVAAAFLPLLQGLADGFPDVLVQPCHKAGALQQRHELGGRNTATGGVIPAHQRFHTHDGAGDAVTLGLQEEAEFVVVQCVLQLAQQLLLFFQLVEHGGLKAVQVAAVCRYTGDLRVVA